MTGWWMVVFWLLLVPLIVVELIVYLKSKKFFWLVYALAIFTYVIAVSYAIDVFSLGKNTVILILLASAALMFLVGQRLGKRVDSKTGKTRANRATIAAIVTLGAILVVVFTVSVVFGRLSLSLTPVASIPSGEILINNARGAGMVPGGAIPALQTDGIVIFNQTYTNGFILPVPIKQEYYQVCLVMNDGAVQLGQVYASTDQYPELGAGQTRVIGYRVQPDQVYDANATYVPQQVLVYQTTVDKRWMPCDAEPGVLLYNITVV